MPSPSELATLVAAEARFDRELAAAREAALEAAAHARRRAEAAALTVDEQIAREHERIAREIAAQTDVQLCAIADDARAQIARFAELDGERLVAIARAIVDRLVELASSEDAP